MTIASIDKHPIIRKGLGLFLQEYFETAIMLEAENFAFYEELHGKQQPDLFIVGFAEESTIPESAVVGVIKKKSPQTPVIVYDGEARYEMATSCMAAGADAYLVKNSCVTELVKCIEAVMNGKKHLSADMIKILMKQSQLNNSEKTDFLPVSTAAKKSKRQFPGLMAL